MWKIFFCQLIFLFSITGITAETTEYRHLKVNPEKVETLADEQAFNYEADADVWEGLREWFLNWLSSLLPETTTFVPGNTMIMIFFGILVVLFVLGIAFGISPKNILMSNPAIHHTQYGTVSAGKSIDLSEYIRTALHDKRYREAVRGYFLSALDQLEASGMITRDSAKTNYHYLTELQSDKAVYSTFHSLINIYQQLWYGEKTAGPEQAGRAEEHIRELEEHLKKSDEQK